MTGDAEQKIYKPIKAVSQDLALVKAVQEKPVSMQPRATTIQSNLAKPAIITKFARVGMV